MAIEHAGVWVDRLSCRPLMIACDIASMLLYASLPAAAGLGVLTTWQLGFVALLAGIANVFFATAYQVYLPSLVTAADLIEGNATLQGSASAAGIGGRGVAGLAAQAVGAATALLFNAASFVVSAACLLSIRAGPARKPARAMTTARRRYSRAADSAGIAIGSIIASSFRQAYCPPSMLGRATASMRFLGFGSVPFGALAAGGLATAFGIRSALWLILAIDALSGTILLTPAIRSRKNLPSEPEAGKRGNQP